MVFFGLNISDSLVTRGSGTSTTAVCTSKRPAEAVVGVLPRVRALKMVVFPDWGNPIIPSFILSLYVGRIVPFGDASRPICLTKFYLDLHVGSGILANSNCRSFYYAALCKKPKWRNRQTRTTQNRVPYGNEGSIPSFGTADYTLMGYLKNVLSNSEDVLLNAGIILDCNLCDFRILRDNRAYHIHPTRRRYAINE